MKYEELVDYISDNCNEEPTINEHALKVLEKRYLIKDADGSVLETPADMFRRVAAVIASASEKYNEDEKEDAIKFYRVMTEMKFLPNSPTLRGAGRNTMLSACSVLPISDSRRSIFDTLNDAIELQAHGSGVGFNFSPLRHKGAPVRTTGGIASGPISFMSVFDLAIGKVIAQGGVRQGASIGILRYDHPDILDFISCKADGVSLTNFNISVGITEDFMKLASDGSDFPLIDHLGNEVGRMNASELLRSIAEQAHATGDPGIIFLDRIDNDNPTPHVGKIVSTNPCVTGDTPIMTSNGYIPIGELIDQEVEVWNGKEFMAVKPYMTSSSSNIWKVEFSDGSYLECTDNHKFFTKGNEQPVELSKLSIGTELEKFDYPVIEGKIDSDEDPNVPWDKRWVPNGSHTKKVRLSWLAGLLDTDGGCNGYGSISREFLYKVKMMIHTLGVSAVLSGSKDYWRLTIPGSGMAKLISLGLKTHRIDTTHIVSRDATRFIRVTNIVDTGRKEATYCFTEPKTHKGMFGCVVTGQCSEEPLLPYELCNLGSINLSKFVVDGEFDYDALGEVVDIGTKFLDNVIDCNIYPLEEVEKITKGNRKIGLGVMGWADTLSLMDIPYNSDAAVKLGGNIMKYIYDRAKVASIELAKNRGPFPNFPGSRLDDGNPPIRNASLTCVAPTGTLSLIADCSGGIEPYFMLAYKRGSIYDANGKATIESILRCSTLDRKLSEDGYDLDEDSWTEIVTTGSLSGVKSLPKRFTKVFPTAHEILPSWHLKMLAAFQRSCTASTSKTVNLSHDSTVEDVLNVYMGAYKMGVIKGVTVYRDGCKQDQVMKSVSSNDVSVDTSTPVMLNGDRPKKLHGFIERIETPVGTLYATMGVTDDGLPVEMFLNISKAGSDITADAEAMGKLVSLCLQYSIPPELIVHRLSGIGGSGSTGFGKNRVRSLPDAISKVLETNFMDKGPTSHDRPLKRTGNMCPDCGHMLMEVEGCTKCPECGYSKC